MLNVYTNEERTYAAIRFDRALLSLDVTLRRTAARRRVPECAIRIDCHCVGVD
jgi:hypothetical protein